LILREFIENDQMKSVEEVKVGKVVEKLLQKQTVEEKSGEKKTN